MTVEVESDESDENTTANPAPATVEEFGQQAAQLLNSPDISTFPIHEF